MMSFVCGAGSALIALLILIVLGNAVCQRLLISTGLQKARDDLFASAQARAQEAKTAAVTPTPPGVGAWIGGFERLLMAAGLLSGAWEILVAVIALKTVARFKEIDERIHAEYFLVGSLFSVVWALGVARLWQLYDLHWGVKMSLWLFPVISK